MNIAINITIVITFIVYLVIGIQILIKIQKEKKKAFKLLTETLPLIDQELLRKVLNNIYGN